MADELRSRNPPDIAAPGIGIVSAFINFSISILSLMALNIVSVVQAKGEGKRKEKKRKEK
jgi:hypothetical protein